LKLDSRPGESRRKSAFAGMKARGDAFERFQRAVLPRRR
jgi:hypothetical protein